MEVTTQSIWRVVRICLQLLRNLLSCGNLSIRKTTPNPFSNLQMEYLPGEFFPLLSSGRYRVPYLYENFDGNKGERRQ